MQSRRDTKAQRRQAHRVHVVRSSAPSATATCAGFSGCARVPLRREVDSVLQDIGGVAVGEVEELEGDAFLIARYAEGGKEHVD